MLYPLVRRCHYWRLQHRAPPRLLLLLLLWCRGNMVLQRRRMRAPWKVETPGTTATTSMRVMLLALWRRSRPARRGLLGWRLVLLA